MRNEVIFDDRGRPDILVVFTPDELKLPDTLKGRKVKEYAISKYPNTMIDGRPYSLPFMPPAVNVNHDEAIRLCEAKGPGWHLITNDEWAALARQSWENDTVPTGNTNSGKSHSHPEQKGTTYQNSYGKTLAGSGPIGWNHDRTAEGVADMVGNVWEHVGGVRFLNGQVQIIPNNEAAAGADQSPDSKEWTAIYTPDGDPVYYNVKDGEIVLQPTAPKEKDYDGVPFCDLHERTDMEVPDKLIELGLYPAPDYESEEYFWLDTDGERCVCRGGHWSDGPSAGVAMAVVMASALTGRPVDGHVAVTGEVSVRGLVKPVGGVPGKVEAAERAGLTTVLIPADNRLERFEHTTIEVVPINTLEEAIDRMLLPVSAIAREDAPAAPGITPVPVLAAEEKTAASKG